MCKLMVASKFYETTETNLWVAPEHGLVGMVFAVFIPKDKTRFYFTRSRKYKYY